MTIASQLEQLAHRISTLPRELLAGFPLAVENDEVAGRFFKCRLYSAFEPVDLDGEIATLAILRVSGLDDRTIDAHKLFSLASGEEGVLGLDRLVRLIHSLNHFYVHGRTERLVLPVNLRLFSYVKTGYGTRFADLLAHFGLPQQNIILALPDSALAGVDLAEISAAYATAGFKTCTALR